MSRIVVVGAAQVGAIPREESRESVVQRLCALTERAHRRGVDVLVFPELCLTPFFPRWYEEDVATVDAWYESTFPPKGLEPLFAMAREYRITLHLGYAERVEEVDDAGVLRTRRFNVAVIVSPDGELMLKYRKIHLPGHKEYIPERRLQHLEKRYFEVGNLGFPVVRAALNGVATNMGALICNDRRWPEAWRVLGLQEVELVMVGYNTPVDHLDQKFYQPHYLKVFHSDLSVQAGCYQNTCFAVAVAKTGSGEGQAMIAGSIIVNPSGEIIARASGDGDELIVAECDLDLCLVNRGTPDRPATFNFAHHRRPEAYGAIVSQVGSQPPPVWKPSR